MLFNSASCVSVLGQCFRSGVVVCLKAPSNGDYPEFGAVTHVLVPEESKMLLVMKFSTGSYCSHYNAYCVTKTATFIVVNVDELALHDVFHPYQMSSMYYIVVRSCYHVELYV